MSKEEEKWSRRGDGKDDDVADEKIDYSHEEKGILVIKPIYMFGS